MSHQEPTVDENAEEVEATPTLPMDMERARSIRRVIQSNDTRERDRLQEEPVVVMPTCPRVVKSPKLLTAVLNYANSTPSPIKPKSSRVYARGHTLYIVDLDDSMAPPLLTKRHVGNTARSVTSTTLLDQGILDTLCRGMELIHTGTRKNPVRTDTEVAYDSYESSCSDMFSDIDEDEVDSDTPVPSSAATTYFTEPKPVSNIIPPVPVYKPTPRVAVEADKNKPKTLKQLLGDDVPDYENAYFSDPEDDIREEVSKPKKGIEKQRLNEDMHKISGMMEKRPPTRDSSGESNSKRSKH